MQIRLNLHRYLFWQRLGLGVLLMLLLNSCSVQKLAVRSTGGILANGMSALYEESDLILAEQTVGSNLKLLEAVIKSDPGNNGLLVMAAEGYTSYALGFVEDESPQRASQFYLRAKNYGLTILKKNAKFAAALDGNQNDFLAALNTFKAKDVAALFWTTPGAAISV